MYRLVIMVCSNKSFQRSNYIVKVKSSLIFSLLQLTNYTEISTVAVCSCLNKDLVNLFKYIFVQQKKTLNEIKGNE